ncbi:telokin-like, partial [Saccoglossus kowalevskii]|uniref:Myosin light chain kinase, smooth muscle-like n=1 Tax=Saccoglossus kowalevskii TaxID=10224 RepID=A0ABM0MLP9_SACKO
SEEEQSKPGVLLKKQNIASKQDLAPAKPEVKSIRDKAPEFVLRPRNATGSETKSAKFTCTIEGKPTPSVIWKFEDRILKDAGRFEIYDEDGVYYLEIFELQATDSGMYTCILSNAVGKAIAKASLTVI